MGLLSCGKEQPQITVPTLQPVGGSDATSQPWGEIPLDDNGTPTLRLAVYRLGYFAEDRALICLDPIPLDFTLGSAICQGDASKRVAIKAENVDQSCEPMRQDRVKTQTFLSFADCDSGVIVATYDPFEPQLLFGLRAMED